MRTTLPLIVSTLAVSTSLMMVDRGAAQSQPSDVASTRHNLSATGPGPVRVEGSTGVCRFCHTPHSANPIAPLWNRDDPGTYYQTYDSSTLVADVGQPSGSSRLCLSCHDGTIALTQTYNPRNAPGGTTVYITPGDSGFIGTDLSDDHPISFVYDSGLALLSDNVRDPIILPPQLPLDHEDRLQCATCHEPHDDSMGNFLRMDNTGSQLCISCHSFEGWRTSAHATAPASLAGSSDTWDNLDDINTVRDAACESCHRPHSAGGRQRLLRHEAEEENCMNCHDGSVARTDLRPALNALSTHPVRLTTGVHDPAENPVTMSEHVECADCHNPHRSRRGGQEQAPYLKPSMAGATGVYRPNLTAGEAEFEYQVCYKCHGSRNVSSPTVDRILDSSDLSDAFSTANASYHPVVAQGRNPNVPSLLQKYNTASMIYCTDCHGSDDPSSAAGPHGSRFAPLLTHNYSTRPTTVESPQAYDLCYQCHNRNSILADESFPAHEEHIEENVSCSVCHDPHGVRENTHLINFDRSVVEPASNGVGPTFSDLGTFRGSCTLSCHGEDHIDESY